VTKLLEILLGKGDDREMAVKIRSICDSRSLPKLGKRLPDPEGKQQQNLEQIETP
jgi:hypothetical protein